MASKVHTGDMAKVEKWFRDNPDKATTSVDLADLFGLKRWQVNNAITWLKKKNIVVPAEKFSIGRAHYTTYRLRKENEVRNEFQVAKPVAKPVKTPEMTWPVLTEFELDKLEGAAKLVLNALYGKDQGRIQALNPTTFIAWNSREQMEEMRRIALGYSQ